MGHQLGVLTHSNVLGDGEVAEHAAVLESPGEAEPGDFPFDARGVFTGPEHGTTHISIVDAQGHAAALTTTIESAFGSFQMVEGFLLNNQLTDFAAEPRDEAGQLQANRVQPDKRPRSSMAPTLVFDGTPLARGELRAVVGSPGGSRGPVHPTEPGGCRANGLISRSGRPCGRGARATGCRKDEGRSSRPLGTPGPSSSR